MTSVGICFPVFQTTNGDNVDPKILTDVSLISGAAICCLILIALTT